MFHPDDQVRIGNQRQISQCFTQVARTDLAGSTGPVYRFGKAYLWVLVHGAHITAIGKTRQYFVLQK
jgi:L-asparagine transporter-like permease